VDFVELIFVLFYILFVYIFQFYIFQFLKKNMDKLPEMPQLPQMPEMPEMPKMPEMPQMPQMPSLDSFSSSTEVSTSENSFLSSNSIVAKFVFVLFVLIASFFVFYLGMQLIYFFKQPSKNPYLVKGLIQGDYAMVVTQDPNIAQSATVFRSNNQTAGIEATWSVWLNITDLKQSKNTSCTNDTNDVPTSFSNIFNKGNTIYSTSQTTASIDINDEVTINSNVGIATINNAPGVYVSDMPCDGSKQPRCILRIYFDEIDNNKHFVEITNIPMKLWFHLAIRIKGNYMDVYINGVVTKRQEFKSVPKQNFDDVNICQNGGFTGQLSNLVAYSYALSVLEINNILLRGPDLTQVSSSNTGFYSYLSTSWYASKL